MMEEATILRIAAHTEFAVSRYSWGHEKLRKQTRRMLKENKLILVGRNNKQFLYRAKENENGIPEL